jgi:peptidoglycan/LPS O-acetylase OafA/YrhL
MPTASARWPARYELLDGLRGLAALAVVMHHVGVVNIGHFSVMIFFVISGYCITASAESCRSQSRGFGVFMLKRIRRIYPPYLLAMVFFAITRYIKALRGSPDQLHRPLLDWIQNFTLTQWVSELFHPERWPADNPKIFVGAFWSLNYEEQFYLVMALCLVAAVRFRLSILASVVTVGACGLAWNWLHPGNLVYGWFLEYWVHFSLGSCLFYALCRFDGSQRRLFVGLVAALGLACGLRALVHAEDAYQDYRAMVEIAFLCGVTVGLYYLRPLSKPISESLTWRPIAAIGTISYSLYLIHQFNLTAVALIAARLLPEGAPRLLMVAITVMLHLVLATAFWSLCERPFLGRKPAPSRALALA